MELGPTSKVTLKAKVSLSIDMLKNFTYEYSTSLVDFCETEAKETTRVILSFTTESEKKTSLALCGFLRPHFDVKSSCKNLLNTQVLGISLLLIPACI